MIMRQGGWRGWAARMLLPALLFVALLPHGYMPDIPALGRGEVTLTLCRVAEPRADDGAASAGFDHLALCPFGLLPALSAPVEPIPIIVPWRWRIIAARSVTSVIPKTKAWITGLGARGPPGA